jgi:predicted Zn-dependent peptidase
MDNLHWTEVDGVTTIWTDAPEPLRAALLFRTGQADETLITAGHTHLVEHMALAEMADFTQTSNGFVGGTVSGFVNVGRSEDMCIFFRNLCEGLASLPVDRLEAEKKILLAEAAGRQYNVNENLLVWRYGAAGYGLVGLPQLGIRGATTEQLQAWAKQRFTRGNAILWLSGPVPPDLRLDLPPEEKQGVPPLVPIQSTFPSWFVDDQCGGVAVSATVPRLVAGPIFCQIAAKRMHERLRNKQAVSYSPTTFYEPLNAEIAHLVLFADSEKDRRAELAEAFGEFFEKLTEIDESEVEMARKLYIDQMTGPLAPPLADRLAREAHWAAMDWLFGRPYKSLDQLTEEACSVTADTVKAFGEVARKNAMFAVPGETTIAPWMGEKIPFSAGKMVEGREILHADAPVETCRLVIGPEGVTFKSAKGLHLTVRYADLVAALQYDDGALELVSSDSTWLSIEPRLWRNGAKICGEVREKIPPDLILKQDPRDEDDIPNPKTTGWQRFRAALAQNKDRLRTLAKRSAGNMNK